jgi:hypothetical protein
MSLSEEKEILLSQLVDGELPTDQANQLLAETLGELTDVLDNSEACRRLKAMLDLHRTLDVWRQQENPRAIVALAQPARTAPRAGWRVMSLATAAMLGGILVAGGYSLGIRLGGERAGVSIAQGPAVVVTPEQRREIAQAFALHESVAGPLSWYAADDATIHVAPAQEGESLRQPVAIVLRLSPDCSCPGGLAKTAKTYVIVCRGNDATLELPWSTSASALHLRLLSTETGGRVNLQYVLAADAAKPSRDDAVLAGRRSVGLGRTSLGQLAMNDCLINVDASAWVMGDHPKL